MSRPKYGDRGRHKKDSLHGVTRTNLTSVVRTSAVQLILQNLTGKVGPWRVFSGRGGGGWRPWDFCLCMRSNAVTFLVLYKLSDRKVFCAECVMLPGAALP